MGLSDSAIRERIRICEQQLAELEKNKNKYDPDIYQDEKEDIEFEIVCWKWQLEFGTASIWQ